MALTTLDGEVDMPIQTARPYRDWQPCGVPNSVQTSRQGMCTSMATRVLFFYNQFITSSDFAG